MATTSTVSPAYIKLVRKFPLRPIRSEADLDRATAMVKSLVVRLPELTPDERDYLDVLGDLVEKYEEVHYPIRDVPPHEMLRELMGDNKAMVHNLREAREVAEKHEDVGTTSMLETFIDAAERRTWFLFESAQSTDRQR